MSKNITTRSHILLILAGLFWVALLAAGFTILAYEEFTPVATTPVRANFPSHSTIPLATDKFTLLLFLHPYCPCSRATLHGLDEFLAQTPNKVSTTIIFCIPKGISPGWEQGDLWTKAKSMPGVHILLDQEAVEAQRFGVIGSGHTLLYNPAGKLLFSGGITDSRGHEGDNPGLSAIVSFVQKGHSSVGNTPVFGCSLL